MSDKLFQNIIYQMREAIDRTVGVIDETGNIISCSVLEKMRQPIGVDVESIFSTNTPVCLDGTTYLTFGSHLRHDYAVFVEGDDEEAQKYAHILSVSLANIKQFYDEKFDRSNFIKNVILDNILPGDIFVKARELRFNNDTTRVILLIRTDGHEDAAVFDIIQNLFPDKTKDFVISINEKDIALVKEVKNNIDPKDLEKLAHSICDALSTEIYANAVVGIGTPIVGLRELSRSLREAQIALEVGKVFDTEKNIVSYDNLGIARLIYQLPTTLCDMFLQEVFKRGSIENLDQETLFTIQKFFENNLNVSETSRKLFVHRNTLVYRLEKIKKFTGLDLREFDDAIIFKVALMVKKYLDSNPTKF